MGIELVPEIDQRHLRRLIRQYQYGARKCFWCGGQVIYSGTDDASMTMDHVLPRAKGGTDGGRRKENMVVAHRWCNGQRGDSTDWVPRALWPQFPPPDSQKRAMRRFGIHVR